MLKNLLTIVCLLLFLFLPNLVKCQDLTGRLVSPDHKLEITFQTGQLDKKGAANQLYYTVSFNGKLLFKPSLLSLDINGAQPLGADVRITNSKIAAGNEAYQLVLGKAGKVSEQYNALQLELQENSSPGRKLMI